MRGVANTYPLTIDFCVKLGSVLGRHFCNDRHRIAIARDTRVSSPMIFSALACLVPMLLGLRLWDSIPEFIETGLIGSIAR